MAEVSDAIAHAKRAGYSDADITAYLAKDPTFGPKVRTAKSAGYGDSEIVAHLNQRQAAAPVTVSGTAKAVGSGAAGAGLALTGGSLGDIREQGKAFTDRVLGSLVNAGIIHPDQAAAAHKTIGDVYRTLNPIEAGMSGVNRIAALTAAATDSPTPPPVHVMSTPELQAATHTDYTPQNRVERFAKTGGAMAVNALAPGSAAARVASVVLPTVGSEGAREVVEAAGGGTEAQNVASIAGGLAGGVASGARVNAEPRATAPETAVGVSPENPVAPPIAQAAARYVASRAKASDPAMVEAQASGKPVIAAEALGQSGRTALGALARRSGATADTLGPMMQERIAGAPGRMQGDFEAATGISPQAVQGDFEGMIEAKRSGPVKQAYDAALANKPNMEASGGNAVPLSKLMEEPEIATAYGYAKRKLGSAAEADGQPTSEALDLTKKFLGKMVKRDNLTGRPITSGSDGIGNQFTLDNERAFTAALREAIPGYADALTKAGDYLSLQRAHEAGGTMVLNPRTSARDVQAAVAKLSDAEKEAFKGGIANKLFQLSENGRLNPKTVATPGVVSKIRVALGEKPAKQFLTGAAQERLLTEQARRMMPGTNSPTAEYGAEMAAQDQAGPLSQAAGEFLRDTAVGTAATLGNVGIAAKIAALRQVGKAASGVTKNMLAGAYGMPQAVRDEAGRILMSEMTPEQVRSYTKLTGAQQDRSLRILIRSPAVLGRPAFINAAALGLLSGASTQRQEQQ